MRTALSRGDGSAEFGDQQSFDRAVAHLVRLIAIPAESAEWFSEKDLVPISKRTWKNTLRNPAVLAISIAVAVIAGVFVFNFVTHLHDFPGSATARKLLGVAASTRPVMLDPVNAEAGTLSDLFFMKHGLEHYDVPEEFADFATIGCRVFEDDESRRIAQIWVSEKRMLLKFGSLKNACNSFCFRRRETARREQCSGFPAGAMFTRKVGQGQ
jgi:hypothetical protein